ncbi:MAG: 50S ribosomal protein L4 [Minisyncoccia bacterium]|jgi:large subunit ribosomal protein L4
MTAEVLNKDNKKIGTLELPERLFGAKWNPELVKQVLTVQLSNRHLPWAHTKDRSEVRGGGKKPWAQKHTGRSRHGSSRSPLWSGGGITFGPRNERDYSRKINSKMKQQALFSLLSKKLKDNDLKIVDAMALTAPKTKEASVLIKNIFKTPSSVIVVPAKSNKNMKLAARNIPKVNVLSPNSLSVYDVLASKGIFFEKDSVGEFIGQYQK